MITAFARALRQFDDPAFRRPLWRGLALALVIFGALWGLMWLLLTRTQFFETVWLDWATQALGGLAVIILTFILFPTVAAAILSLFLDSVITAVERRHYPGLPPPRQPGFGELAAGAARFIVVAVGLNLICLPLYLIPGLNLVVFYGLNGYLLGREYFEMVAPRRLLPEAARALWRRYRLMAIIAGAVIAFISLLPLINLVAPVVAAAAMTHLVEGWRQHRDDAGATNSESTTTIRRKDSRHHVSPQER